MAGFSRNTGHGSIDTATTVPGIFYRINCRNEGNDSETRCDRRGYGKTVWCVETRPNEYHVHAVGCYASCTGKVETDVSMVSESRKLEG